MTPPRHADIAVHSGIDEAGYGPLIGPLCLAAATFAAPFDKRELENPHATPPDFWAALHPAVHSSRHQWNAAKRRGLVIADSKACKLPNRSTTDHPLTHLERAALATLHCLDRPADDDATLFDRTHIRPTKPPASCPWYADKPPTPLPLSTSADHIALLAGALRRAADRARTTPLDLAATTLHEHDFNAHISASRSKASVNLRLALALADRVRRSAAARSAWHVHRLPALITIDRQSGRTRYAQALAQHLDTSVTTRLESTERSVYDLPASSDGRAAPARFTFQVDADANHLTVALASMTAKLVRELHMLRLNRYWQRFIPELKPTAGYRNDAHRFIEQLNNAGFPEQARAITRLA